MEFEFRPDREAHLRALCEEMGRSVDEVVNEAVLTFMEDYEDGRDGAAAWAEHLASGEKLITQAEMEREFGLDRTVSEFHPENSLGALTLQSARESFALWESV